MKLFLLQKKLSVQGLDSFNLKQPNCLYKHQISNLIFLYHMQQMKTYLSVLLYCCYEMHVPNFQLFFYYVQFLYSLKYELLFSSYDSIRKQKGYIFILSQLILDLERCFVCCLLYLFLGFLSKRKKNNSCTLICSIKEMKLQKKNMNIDPLTNVYGLE